MSVGKRRRGAHERWHVHIPEHLALRFDSLYVDRSRDRLIYGIRSQIITELLEKHVSELESRGVLPQLPAPDETASELLA